VNIGLERTVKWVPSLLFLFNSVFPPQKLSFNSYVPQKTQVLGPRKAESQIVEEKMPKKLSEKFGFSQFYHVTVELKRDYMVVVKILNFFKKKKRFFYFFRNFGFLGIIVVARQAMCYQNVQKVS
jgi:hypothetical protein